MLTNSAIASKVLVIVVEVTTPFQTSFGDLNINYLTPLLSKYFVETPQVCFSTVVIIV